MAQSDDGKLYAINPDGTQKWNFTTGSYVYSSPAIGKYGEIYFGSADGKLYALGKTPPSSPKNLEANSGDKFVNLTWDASSFDGGSTILGYRIYRNSSLVDTVLSTQLWYNDTSVVNGVLYTYYVTAVNSVGESGESNVIRVIPDPMDRGLIAWYKFDNGTGDMAYDYSGHNNDGLIEGAAWIGGVVKSALSFDGSSDVNCQNLADYMESNQVKSITHAAWVKFSVSGQNGQITGENQAHIHSELQVETDGRVHFWMEDSSDADYYVKTTNPLNDGKWHFVVGTYDYTTKKMQIWVDALLNQETTYDFEPVNIVDNFYIGYGDSGHYNGTIDEVRIYDRALTSDEIQELYSEVIPSPPRNLKADVHRSFVNLTWDVPSSSGGTDITGYNIYRNDALIDTVSSTQLWYNDSSVVYGNAYRYYVTAVNTAGESYPSNTVLVGPPLANATWPMFHYDLMHTGLSPYDTGDNDGTMIWNFTTGGRIFSSAAITDDGTIYFGSEDGKLYALYLNGTQKWNFTTGAWVGSSPAIAGDGTIYVGSEDDYLYAINPDGTLKWKFYVGDYVDSSPAIGSDGTVYVGSNDGKLYAIYPNGTEKWDFTTGNAVFSSPAIGNDSIIYVGSYDEKLYALYPNGTEKWNFTTGNYIGSSPAIGNDGTIYVGSGDGHLYALYPNGTEKWSFAVSSWSSVDSSPAIGKDGTIYFGSSDSYVYALYPDGTLKWKFKTGSSVTSSPAIGSDGAIYVGSDDGKLYAIYPNGTEKWNFTTGDYVRSSPAIDSNGTIYVGSNDGKLYALGKSAPWSMFHCNPRHTGLSPYNTSYNDGTQKWNFTTGGNVVSSPAIGIDGTIYVGSYDYYLYAIYPNGTLKWKFQTGDVVYSSPAIANDGTIYVGSWDDYIYAINPDGTLKWKFQTGNIVLSSPTIGNDGIIYVGSYDDYIYAIYPNGTLKWKFQTGNWVQSSPAIGSDGTIYVGSEDNYLYAIYPNGTLKWKFKAGDYVDSSPAIGSDGTIYVGSNDGKLYALYPNGTQKWNFTTGNYVHSSPGIGMDGTIYVGSCDNYLYAINPDGTLKWKFQTGNWVQSSPAIGSDGTIYVGSEDNYLYAIYPNGTLKWKFKAGDYVDSSPAIGSDGTIYVGSNDGKLYAIAKITPSAPQNLQANAGDGYVNLTWDAPDYNGGNEITGYKIYRNGTYVTTVPASQLWYNDTSVVNGVTYTYYVTAVNSAGEGDKSNEVQATPSGIIPEFSVWIIIIITIAILVSTVMRREKSV